MRLSPNGEEGSVVAVWPRIAQNTEYVLAAAPEGALYIAASRARHNSLHFVVRLALRSGGDVALDGFAMGHGAIALSTGHTSRRGLTIYVTDRGGSVTPVGYEAADLRVIGRADVARCF